MDLTQLDTATPCDDGAEINILHPVTRVPTDIYIRVVGKDSERFRAHTRAAINEEMRKAQAAKKRGKQPDAPTVEAAEERAVGLLAACTTGWRTGEDAALLVDGERVAFSIEAARRIYADPRFRTVRDQVDEGIADLENFIKS